jgi:hypothetical protein
MMIAMLRFGKKNEEKPVSFNTTAVFKISGVPEHTFVERDRISKLIDEHLETKDGVLLFLGYSKSGKTVFRKKHVEGKDLNIVTYRGNNVSTIESLYTQIATQMGTAQKKERQQSQKSSYTTDTQVQVGNQNFGHVNDRTEQGTESSIAVTSELSMVDIDVNFLCNNLGGQNVLVIIEDYHLVSPEFNRLLSEDLKHFLDEEILFLLIGIPSTPNRALRNNPDLSGRMNHISFDYLSREEIKEIIAKGTKLLNVEFKEDVIEEIITASFKNAYLVQYICRTIITNREIRSTATNLVVIHDANEVKGACRTIAEILDNDYSSIYNVIAAGSRSQKADKVFNQYEELLKAIKHFDIEHWEKGVSSNEIANWAWLNISTEKREINTSAEGNYKSEKTFKESLRSGIKGAISTLNDNLISNSTKQIVYVSDNTLYLTDLIFKFYINWKSDNTE